MTEKTPGTGASRSEALLRARLREELRAGMLAARDPDNAGLPDLYLRTTTMYSPWYTRVCPVCQHRFREGDRVRLCPGCGQAYHDDDQYGLHCWPAHFEDGGVCREPKHDRFNDIFRPGCDYVWPGTFPDETEMASEQARAHRRIPEVTRQFLNGLETVWTPFGEARVLEVPPDSPIVGHNCPWCRFQIRAGDRVVKCPCGNCDTYFHDDLFRHLTCWDDWHNGPHGNDFCPTTGAAIPRRGARDGG